MSVIKAFVGHSFRPIDKPVVDAILEILNRVKQLRSDFDWEHALEPEPKTVDAKVLALFQDKTLFIGICTRAERAIAEEHLAHLWGRRHAKESAFEWKASDWLLQEIGLSIGRGMNIILLVERGTREPGDLQGNWERIEFDRTAPEKCFAPLLGMIANLAGKAGAPGTSVIDQPAQVEPAPATSPEKTISDIWEPDDTWTLQTYQVAFRVVTRREGPEKASKIAVAFASSQLATDQNRASWNAFLQLTKLQAGIGTLSDVLAHASEHPTNAGIAALVAEAYEHFSESGEAASWYARASALSSDTIDQIFYFRLGVVTALKGGKDALSASLHAKLLLIEPTAPESLKALLAAELEVAEVKKEDAVAIASLEKLLSLDPSDNDRRFKLAFKYSHTGRSDMAAFHYEKIPASLRTTAGWNNLGVAYEDLSFVIRAVDAYRRAADSGETLAAANIAKRFLDAGFVQEARSVLEAASRNPEHDKLVDTRFAEAKEARDEEGEARDKLLANSRATSDFYAVYGEARLAQDLVDVSGSWKTPHGLATVELLGTRFVATLEQPRLGLMGLALAGQAGSDTTNSVRRVTVAGNRLGHTVAATISSDDEPVKRRSLLDASGDPKALIRMSPDGNELNFMESGADGKAPRFYTWRRVPDSGINSA